MTKKNILIFSGRYLPGYKAGGPIRSIANMIEAISDDYDFYIVTRDRDSGDEDPYPNIIVNDWNKVGKAQVFYTSPKISYEQIKNVLNERDYHKLYLNSFFSISFSFIPFLLNSFNKGKGIKTIIAPRGEFSEGALELKSFKKKLFIKITSFFNLYKNVIWQASSKYEAEDIKNTVKISKNNILVAPNIPHVFNSVNYKNHFSGTLRVLFISRISPKKNLVFIFEVLKQVKCNVEFNIFGLIDDESYWRKCEKLIKELPSNIKVFYNGSVSNDKVLSILSEHHVFILPTKGENYGHAIVESFMAGTPVLISDTTPWRNLEADSVGWDIPLKDKLKYVQTIELLYANMDKGLFHNRDHIRKWIVEKIQFTEVVNLNKNLFV